MSSPKSNFQHMKHYNTQDMLHADRLCLLQELYNL